MNFNEDQDGEQVLDDPRGATDPASLGTTAAGQTPSGRGYSFTRGVVQEVISNPAEYLSRVVKDPDTGEDAGTIKDYMVYDTDVKERDPFVSNHSVSRWMPLNSIACYVGEGRLSSGAKPVIAYPFFPQHLQLPLKPGEHVWVLVESIGNNITNYHWMCRVSSDRQIDDVNYTFHDRNFHIRKLYDSFLTTGNVTDEEDTFLVGSRSSITSPNSPLPAGMSYDKLCAQSLAYLEDFTGEPVPRKFGKCGDMLIQGSNNTLISLTTEMFKEKEEIDDTLFVNPDASSNSANMLTPLAGTIDIVVGREKERLKALSTSTDSVEDGQLNITLGHRGSGAESLEHFEVDKLDEPQGRGENKIEGLDSPRDVYARMYVGMNSTPDESFEMPNEDFEKQEGSTVVNYSDLCRTFAEENVRICNLAGNSVIDMASDGSITLQTGDGDTAAKIILKASGDIIIKPGSDGLLHLGGDENDTSTAVCGITCTATGGTAVAAAALSGMGGMMMAGDGVPGNGFTSSKVVLKV